jgi:cell division protein FtsZ
LGYELANDQGKVVQIKVVGVGGGGGNAVDRMIAEGVKGAEFIAMNTDVQVLAVSRATQKIQLGERATHGMGAGGKPELGAKAAEESTEAIKESLRGADMVFITAGMGGGTGTGAAPVIASIAKEMEILTIGVVTKPFRFEMLMRMRAAEEGIKRLSDSVDSLIVIPNENLLKMHTEKLTMKEAFAMADQVLLEGVKNISELINIPAFMNLDFNDLTTVMRGAGYAHLGVGHGTGENKVAKAAEQAVTSPLLETSLNGAKGLIINISASNDIGLTEVQEVVDYVTESVDQEALNIVGIRLDDTLQDEISVMVIATGFPPTEQPIVATKPGIPIGKQHLGATPLQTVKPESKPAPATLPKPKPLVPPTPVRHEPPPAPISATNIPSPDDDDIITRFFGEPVTPVASGSGQGTPPRRNTEDFRKPKAEDASPIAGDHDAVLRMLLEKVTRDQR